MMHENLMFDIVIVGGGLVAQIFALMARQHQLSVCILEKNAWDTMLPADPLDYRHITLSRSSQSLLTDYDLWSDLAAEAEKITKILISEKGTCIQTALTPLLPYQPALGYVVPYHILQRVFLRKIKADSAIRYIAGQSVDLPIRTETGWEIKLPEISLSAKLLVAADGMRSPLRTAMGISSFEKNYQQAAIVTSLRVSSPVPGLAIERFSEDGFLAVLPAGADRVAVIYVASQTTAEKLFSASKSIFLEKIQTLLAYRLGVLTELGQRQSFPLFLSVAQRVYEPGFLLMGSAAHHLHPIAAQGFNLALRDVVGFLETADAFQGRIADPACLAAYAKRRKTDQERTVRFTDGLIRLFSLQSLPARFLRRLALFTIDKSYLAQAWVSAYGAGQLGSLE